MPYIDLQLIFCLPLLTIMPFSPDTGRQIYNLLFEKFFLVNFTRRIRMSDEFRLMNSLDNLIRVRIYYWKHVLVDGTSLTMTSEGGGGR